MRAGFYVLTRAGVPDELVHRDDTVHVGLSTDFEASGRLLMGGDSEGLLFGKTLVSDFKFFALNSHSSGSTLQIHTRRAPSIDHEPITNCFRFAT